MSSALGLPHTSDGPFNSNADALSKVDATFINEDDRILSWLSATNHVACLNSIVARRTKDTGGWLLNSTTFDERATFDEWVRTSGQTMFCPGAPGVGKTVITSAVIRELQNSFQGDSKVGLAYFFYSLNSIKEPDSSEVLASLLKQLVEQQHLMPNCVKGLYKRHYDRSTRPSYTEIARAFHSVASSYTRVFIILDALDESRMPNQGYHMILKTVRSIPEEVGISLFATSTFVPEIMREFSDCFTLEIRATQDDIRRYLDDKITMLPEFVSNDAPLREDIKNGIVLAADGVFLLAQLYFHSLVGKPTPEATRLALNVLTTHEGSKSKALDLAHHLVMQRIEYQEANLRKLAKKAMIWAAYANRPLNVSELRHSVGMEIGKSRSDADSLPSVEEIQAACSGLIDIREEEDAIFMHSLTKDYLKRNKGILLSSDIQTHITNICVQYLCRDDFNDGFCCSDEEFESRLKSNALYDYVARNWGEHACIASWEVAELIMDFLNNKSKLAASSQALMASRRCDADHGYSQRVPNNMTAVHIAAFFGLRDILISLIVSGNGLDEKDSHGRTSLSYAAENGHESTVQLLLEEPHIDYNSMDVNNRTPLSWAAENGHQQVVRLLIYEGARIDLQDNIGRTPLSYAAPNGHEEVVKLIIDTSGADLDVKDDYGQTPLSHAAAMGHETVVHLILNESNADPDSKDINGHTPLSHAAANGNTSIVQLFLDVGGVNPDSRDINGITPLAFAASNGYQEVVQLLVQNSGVDPDSRDRNGITPLSRAAARGQVAAVKMLLDLDDVDPESEDIHGQTPYMRAVAMGDTTVAQILQST